MAVGAAEPSAADWYLRAGLGLDRAGKTVFRDRNCSSASPAAFYGCGTGGDGAPYRSVGHFGTMVPLELGLGYAVAPAARLEVLVEYRPAFAFRGRANFLSPESRQSVAADLSLFAGMVAAYIDLPGAGVPKIGPFGPFVGAGLGVAHTRIGQTRMTFPATTTIVPGAGRTDIAWMVTAGVAAALGEPCGVCTVLVLPDSDGVNDEPAELRMGLQVAPEFALDRCGLEIRDTPAHLWSGEFVPLFKALENRFSGSDGRED